MGTAKVNIALESLGRGAMPTKPVAKKPIPGQNSIAPESSLPQLGQVRWGSVLTDLTVLQPKATPGSTEW
jgi:hypothetical protein